MSVMSSKRRLVALSGNLFKDSECTQGLKKACCDNAVPDSRTDQSSYAPAEASSKGGVRCRPSQIPATRSTFRAELVAYKGKRIDRDEPWKTPLLYPKTGNRRATIEYKDLCRLDEGELLNDNLIGFFLRYLEHYLEQTKPELAERVFFYNSYFFEQLMKDLEGKKGIKYENVQKWSKNIDIFRSDFVVVPVIESHHWYLVIIYNLSKFSTLAGSGEEIATEVLSLMNPSLPPTEKQEEVQETQDQPTGKPKKSLSQLSLLLPQVTTPRNSVLDRQKARRSRREHNSSTPIIMTFDSLGVARPKACAALRQYLVKEAENKKGWNIDGSLIPGITATGIPTQPNSTDCGLYLCAYLECFILNPVDFVTRSSTGDKCKHRYANNGKWKAPEQHARADHTTS
jgi:sentrin-specific protease 7